MKYKLNKLELPTTNHFKVNDLEIELNLPKIDNLLEYSIISNEKIIVKTTIKTNNLNTKIGLSFPKYLETNIIIPKNTIIEEPIKITKSLQEKVFPNKLIITCEESSSADFIIEYLTSDEIMVYFTVHDGIVDFSAKTRIERMDGDESNHT